MKVLFYTIDMVEGVEHLMPWRTLVEAARNLSEEYSTAICSAHDSGTSFRIYQGVEIYRIGYGSCELKKFVKSGRWQVVFYPVSYRMGLKDFSGFSMIPAKMIAYVPGGIYPFSGVMALWAKVGFKTALPYLMDNLVPHRALTRKLKKSGFKCIVSQAPLTSSDSIRSGWDKNDVFTALPGIDNFGQIEPDYSLFEKLKLDGKKYLLFSGAPAYIRGSHIALKAFDRIADKVPDVLLVMLMRKDVSSDFSDFDNLLDTIRHKERVLINYEKLGPAHLKAFFIDAYAVLLPFLLIPSEIPLTYFEVLECGTPIITFDNAGTTDYLNQALKIAERRSIKGFADAMLALCHSPYARECLAESAKEIMKRHPSWNKSTEVWKNAIKHSVSLSAE